MGFIRRERRAVRRPGAKLAWAASALLGVLLAFAAPVIAAPHEARVPLRDGKVRIDELSAGLCEGLGVKAVRVPVGGQLDLNGLRGSNFVAAVNASLGDACRVTITPDALVLQVDPDKLPKDCDAAKRAVRVFTAVEAPEAWAAQQKLYGLHLPDHVDPRRPIVVLIHGLDSDRMMWGPLTARLEGAGIQAAYFAYPSDGPIEESAAMLAARLAALRRQYPGVRIDLVCHSMGGLVARAYVEGPDYPGGVDRVILCGTPNGGSTWAKYRLALEVQEHYKLWRHEPTWSVTWMITDGLGEAGDEMNPKSKFLKQLNARPRRDGVRYTIVAGDRHIARSVGADWLDCTASWIPRRAAGWWGFRQCKSCLEGRATSVRQVVGDGDGPVTLASSRLAGVTDVVVVHADHGALCTGTEPAAWPTLRDRLGK